MAGISRGGEEGSRLLTSQRIMEEISMKSPILRRTVPILALLLTVVMAFTAVPAALAQAPTTPPPQSPPAAAADTMDGESGYWGLAGLIGLLGLAGLMRRDRARPTERPMDRERVGRP